jgi:hypothetical protein
MGEQIIWQCRDSRFAVKHINQLHHASLSSLPSPNLLQEDGEDVPARACMHHARGWTGACIDLTMEKERVSTQKSKYKNQRITDMNKLIRERR